MFYKRLCSIHEFYLHLCWGEYLTKRASRVAPQPSEVGANGTYAEYYKREALQYFLDYIEQATDTTSLAKTIVVRRTD